MTANYGPGPWVGLVRGQTAVLLESGTSPELVLTLWDLLGKDPEVHEVLHAVTTGFGGSLTDMPSFGIIGFRDSLRVFLRGDIDLEIDVPDGGKGPGDRNGLVELNGRNVSTWAERWLAERGNFRLSIPGVTADAAWPLIEGVVQLGALAVTLSGASTETEAAGRHPGARRSAGASPDSLGAMPAPEPVAAAPSAAPPREPEQAPEPAPVLDAGATAAEEPSLEVPDLESPELEAPVLDSGVMDAAAVETAVTDAAAVETAVTDAAAEPGATEHPAESPSGGSEVSAETVMGIPDEDLDYTVAPADLPAGEPDSAEAVPSQPALAEAVPEMTGNYDHLWEKTVARSIEDAAVRDDPEEQEEPAGEKPPAEAPSAKAPSPEDAEVAAADHASDPAGYPAQANQAGPPDPEPVAGSGLIESVPWQTSSSPAAPWAPPTPEPPLASQPAPVQPAQAQPANAWPAPAQAAQPHFAASSFDEDHDGQTIMKGDLAGMVAHPAPVVSDPASGPIVLARVCAQGHANPPTNAQCASCRQQLPADAIQVPRPQLGVMRISTGEVVELNQSLVIGRQPSVSRVQGGGMPRLVQVASPSGDISRSHVEVRLEGWHVMLCDLKATNGTVLVRQGQPPRRLAQNEMAILLDGDIAELGDDISLRFEEIA